MLALEHRLSDICFVTFGANTFTAYSYDVTIVTDAYHEHIRVLIDEVVQSIRSSVYCTDNTKYTFVYDNGVLHLVYEGGVIVGCQLQQLPDNLKLTETTQVFKQLLVDVLASVFSGQLGLQYSDIKVTLQPSKNAPLMINCCDSKNSLQALASTSPEVSMVVGGKILHDGGCSGEQYVHVDTCALGSTHTEIFANVVNSFKKVSTGV